jgi:segregation and condensation protein B
MKLESILEVLLFSATTPLATSDLTQLVRKGASVEGEINAEFQKVKEQEIEEALLALQDQRKDQPVFLQQIAGGWRLGSAPEFANWVRQIYEDHRSTRLTQPSLETLAVIAYRQPISRSEIEVIRGVGVGGVLETLLEREVIRIAGRSEAPGRPLLYETTSKFLEHFGLNDLAELPNVEELRKYEFPTPAQSNTEQQPELVPITPANEPQETASTN